MAGLVVQAILLLLCALPAAAQEAAAPAEAPATPPKAAVAIVPIAEIGTTSERSKRILGEIESELAPKAEIQGIAEAVPTLRDRVAAEKAHSEDIRSGAPAIFDIDRLQREWTQLGAELDALQAQLDQRSIEVGTQVERIREQRKTWEATREAAVAQEVSPDVIAQIDEVDSVASLVGEKASERQAVVVGLQSAVAAMSEEMTSDLKAIQETRHNLVGLFLQRDSLPMWSREFWDPMSGEQMSERLGDYLERHDTLISEFWDDHRPSVYTYLAIIAALGAAMIGARRPVQDRLSTEELAPVRAIFDRPVSLALLISFFIVIFTMPGEFRPVAPVLGAASLIPAVLILRQIVDRPLFPLLNLVVGVYFLHQLRELLSPLAGLYRLVLMLEMLVLLGSCGWFLRPARLFDIPREMAASWLFRCVGYALRTVFFFSLVAIFANLAGYGALANLIAQTLIWSSYAAVVLYGASRVADGLVAFLLRVPPLARLGMVEHHRWLLRRRVVLLVHLGAWYLWAKTTLRQAELLDNVELAIEAFLEKALPLPEIEITFGDILAAAATFYGAILLSRFIRFLLEEDVYPHLRLHKGRPYAISTLLHYSILLVGFLLGAMALGFNMNRFTLLAGAFGVGIGFGMQNIVNNFISGIILLTERPVEIGDTIALGEVFGEVQRIGIRSSTVRTWQGAEVIVPNADLIAQQVTNWTLSDRRRRIEIPVGVAYESDPRLVMETLLEVGRTGEHVLADPAPYVLFRAFGESSLDFELRAWTDEFDNFLQVRSQLCTKVVDALKAAGLTIPYPQRDLHIKTAADQVQPSAQGELPPPASDERSSDKDDLDRRVG